MSTEFTWEVRKRNTGRFSILYQQKDGTPISLAGATANLYVYVSTAIALQKSCNILGANQIDVFLTEAEILAFEFEVTDFEIIVTFSNGDKETFVDGRLVVKSGRGPFV